MPDERVNVPTLRVLASVFTQLANKSADDEQKHEWRRAASAITRASRVLAGSKMGNVEAQSNLGRLLAKERVVATRPGPKSRTRRPTMSAKDEAAFAEDMARDAPPPPAKPPGGASVARDPRFRPQAVDLDAPANG